MGELLLCSAFQGLIAYAFDLISGLTVHDVKADRRAFVPPFLTLVPLGRLGVDPWEARDGQQCVNHYREVSLWMIP
jgi:hypothetical protein